MITSHNITISYDSLIDELETLTAKVHEQAKYREMLEAQIVKGNTPAIDRLKADISVLELEADQAKERETVLTEDLRKARAHRDRLLDERDSWIDTATSHRIERDTLQGRLDSMTEKANFFAARLPAVEACIRWAAQQGYCFGQQSADEYCTGKGLEFVTDQAYYNLSKFQEKVS